MKTICYFIYIYFFFYFTIFKNIHSLKTKTGIQVAKKHDDNTDQITPVLGSEKLQIEVHGGMIYCYLEQIDYLKKNKRIEIYTSVFDEASLNKLKKFLKEIMTNSSHVVTFVEI